MAETLDRGCAADHETRPLLRRIGPSLAIALALESLGVAVLWVVDILLTGRQGLASDGSFRSMFLAALLVGAAEVALFAGGAASVLRGVRRGRIGFPGGLILALAAVLSGLNSLAILSGLDSGSPAFGVGVDSAIFLVTLGVTMAIVVLGVGALGRTLRSRVA